MSRVALYGGSFDPFHICHQLVIPYALSLADVEGVIVAPVHTHAFGKKLVDFAHRFRMAQLGIEIFGDAVWVSDIEAQIAREKGKNLTIYTVERLLEQYSTIVLILGTDIMPDLPKWESYDKLKALQDAGRLEFFFSERDGHSRTDWFEINSPAPQVVMPNISSTDVRAAIKAGRPINNLVPGNIVKYIKEHGLYR